MFKLALSPSYPIEINVETPSPTTPGVFDKSTFMAQFKRVSTDEVEKLRKLVQADVMRRVLVGWSDMADENGNTIEFSKDRLEALVAIPQALVATSTAFWDSIHKAKEKN